MGFKTGSFYTDPASPAPSGDMEPLEKYSPKGYDGSMAQAIEEAFKLEWKNVMGSDPPKIDIHMRLLYVAIAQGVLSHIKNNPKGINLSFKIFGFTFNANVEITIDPVPYS
jgi:hypothetical protein